MSSAAAAVWRPRLWVRILAVVAPVVLAVPLVCPENANPNWVNGTPADQAGWGLFLLAAALLLARCAWAVRIEVDADEVRVINLVKIHRVARADITTVRPVPFGVEFLGRHGRTIIGIAVQSTAVFIGDRPRWVDIAAVVTGVAPHWEMD